MIFSYYFPDYRIARALNQFIAATYVYAVAFSLATILFGVVFVFVTSLSFARLYDVFSHLLPQPQQRLASRIDREDDGFFYVDEGEAERIIAYVITNVLNNPSWYQKSIVVKPADNEITSAKYANFLFFGQLLEGRATVGDGLDRWGWAANLYANTDLFEPDRMKELVASRTFAQSLITRLITDSGSKEINVPSLHDLLNAGAAKLGRHHKYDCRNINKAGLWNGLLIKTKLRTRYEMLKRRLIKLNILDDPPAKANTIQLIKLMAARKIWEINWNDVEFAFAPWQCVFLLRSGILKTNLPKFSAWDGDFEWFRDDALRRISKLVQRSLAVLNGTDQQKIKTILGSDIDFAGAIVLADTFLWMLGSKSCRYNNCGQMTSGKGELCPLGQFAICKPIQGKSLFTFRPNDFVLE